MNTPDDKMPRKIIFFLKPLHACMIKQILQGFELEIVAAEEKGNLRATDIMARDAEKDFHRQLAKQFTDIDLEDVRQDMAIVEAFNLNNNDHE